MPRANNKKRNTVKKSLRKNQQNKRQQKRQQNDKIKDNKLNEEDQRSQKSSGNWIMSQKFDLSKIIGVRKVDEVHLQKNKNSYKENYGRDTNMVDDTHNNNKKNNSNNYLSREVDEAQIVLVLQQ